MLKNKGYEVDIATSQTENLTIEAKQLATRIYEIHFSRSPINKNNFMAYKEIKKILNEQRYNVIHVHTPVASAVTRIAANSKSGAKLVYTAHGFHFFKGAPKINWLLYYTIEKLLAKKTSALITLNQEDFEMGKKLGIKNVFKMNGVGVDLKRFSNTKTNNKLKSQLGINNADIVFLSVGELNINKNHRLVIEAFSKLNNNSFKYFICGKGPERENLEKLICQNKLENSIFLLGFRNDINELMKLANVFIFPSRREGLPVSIMEAMASGLPIIASNIRGNNDLVIDKEGGLLFEDNSLVDLVNQLEKVSNQSDINIQKFSNFNIQRIKNYTIESVLYDLDNIYKDIL